MKKVSEGKKVSEVLSSKSVVDGKCAGSKT